MTDTGRHVERIDRGGELRWRSAPGIYSDAAIASDGQVVALAWPETSSEEHTSLRLVRFADP